jgi:SAM-dependent methyltransferase
MTPSSDSAPAAQPVIALAVAVAEALVAGTFVKLTLSKSRRRGNAEATQAFVRVVSIKGEPHISVLYRYPSKDITQNHPVAAAKEGVARLLEDTFQNAHLFTTLADLELRTNNKGESKLHRHKPTFNEPADGAHDRQKRYVLDPATAPYLKELGIVSPEGHVKSDKADKYRQLQNIVKLLDEFVQKSELLTKPRIRVVDFGCGKAYLTFAVHDYFNNHLGIPTDVVGVDRNVALMDSCNTIARQLGYSTLTFLCSNVEEYDPGAVDVLIALHACDTATDVALYKGVAAGASLVIAVPCCQKELRPQLRPPADELPMLKHDTFKDRYAQMLTDAMRGLLMESQGYRSRVIEFISDAHTHRNVMIVAVREPGSRTADEPAKNARMEEVRALKNRYQIQRHTLETLLAAGSDPATTHVS